MKNTDKQLRTFSELIGQIEEQFGQRLHVSTLHRWRTRGIKGRKLAATRLGGRWFGSLADVLGFCSTPNIAPPCVRVNSRGKTTQDQLSREFNM